MLVLSRRSGETVWIGKSIQVRVLEVQGGKVKLGFVVPPDVPIQREEIRRIYPARGVDTWHQSPAVVEVCT